RTGARQIVQATPAWRFRPRGPALAWSGVCCLDSFKLARRTLEDPGRGGRSRPREHRQAGDASRSVSPPVDGTPWVERPRRQPRAPFVPVCRRDVAPDPGPPWISGERGRGVPFWTANL